MRSVIDNLRERLINYWYLDTRPSMEDFDTNAWYWDWSENLGTFWLIHQELIDYILKVGKKEWTISKKE